MAPSRANHVGPPLDGARSRALASALARWVLVPPEGPSMSAPHPDPVAPVLTSPDDLDLVDEGRDSALLRLAHARNIHDNLQQMVNLADHKAYTLIAAETLIAAFFGSAFLDRIKDAGLHSHFWLIVSGATTLLLHVCAALCAVAVLLPRGPRSSDVAPVSTAPRLLWIRDIARFYGRPDHYAAALRTLAPDAAIDDIAHENLRLSWIVERKFQWMRLATWLMLPALVAWGLTVALIVAARA